MAEQRCDRCSRIPWSFHTWQLLARLRKSKDSDYDYSWRSNDSLDDIDFALSLLDEEHIHPSVRARGLHRLQPSQVDQLRTLLDWLPSDHRYGRYNRGYNLHDKPRDDEEQIKIIIFFEFEQETSEVYFNHHPNLNALQHSAAMGCYLCHSLRTYLKPWPSEPTTIRALDSNETRLPFLSIRLGHPKMIGLKSLELEEETADGQELEPKALRRETLDQDLECLVSDVIRPWVENCDAGKSLHQHCRPVTPGIFDRLPTRLIDVGSCSTDNVRLVVTSEDGPRTAEQARYLTLSYCWGQSNDSAKTTPQNFNERQRNIDIASLPRTIQDAIRLTKAMKIRYLWVDALCIIQNLEDFYLEAAKMGSYYSNGYCLISATGFSDSSEGLFPDRNLRDYRMKSCTLGYDDKYEAYWTLSNLYKGLLRRACHNSPVMKRAWCLQEHLLSPRILYVTAETVVWRCQGIPELPEFLTSPETQSLLKWRRFWMTGYGEILSQSSSAGMWLAWTKLIAQYVKMELSQEDDRLTAIQGLGDRLAERHGDRYFGGIFLSHLAQGLLWEGVKRAPGRRSTRCPTWSWGVAGRVKFIGLESSLVSNISQDTTFPSSDGMIEMGSRKMKSLRFSAPLLTMPNMPLVNTEQLGVSVNWPVRRLRFTLTFDEQSLVPSDLSEVKVILLGYTKEDDALVGLVVRKCAGNYQFLERVGYVEASAKDSDIKGKNMDGFFKAWTENVNLA